MFTFSPDARKAEQEMRAVLFVLIAFGHIDGHFDESERAFVMNVVSQLIDRRAAELYGADDAGRVNAIPAWRAHFFHTMSGMEHEIRSWFTESVAQGESAAQFVRARLKLRCYELLERLREKNRAELLAMVNELMHADGVVHPDEVAFRNDLEALLGEEPTRLALPSVAALLGASPARGALAIDDPRPTPIRRAEHPFFSGSEQGYVGEPSLFARQAGSDIELIQRTEARLWEQRSRGQGRLGAEKSFTAFAGQEPFLDGHIAVFPPRPGVEYEVIVLGDLHGCYSCLKAALLQTDFFGKVEAHRAEPGKVPHPLLVFLGDYIDRGRYSYDGILRAALRLYLAAPDHVFLLRGNHEHYIEREGQIRSPVWPAEAILSIAPLAPRDLLAAHMRLFESLPSMLVFERVLFVHAGIPREDTLSSRILSLASLNERDIRFQMMWSDPSDAEHVPFELQKANARFPFGRAQFNLFMNKIGCTMMIRGHERVVEGFRRVYGDPGATLISVFSAGGRTNDDLPPESNYREVTPMALTLKHKDGVSRVTPFPITYERYNDPAYNAFFSGRRAQ